VLFPLFLTSFQNKNLSSYYFLLVILPIKPLICVGPGKEGFYSKFPFKGRKLLLLILLINFFSSSPIGGGGYSFPLQKASLPSSNYSLILEGFLAYFGPWDFISSRGFLSPDILVCISLQSLGNFFPKGIGSLLNFFTPFNLCFPWGWEIFKGGILGFFKIFGREVPINPPFLFPGKFLFLLYIIPLLFGVKTPPKLGGTYFPPPLVVKWGASLKTLFNIPTPLFFRGLTLLNPLYFFPGLREPF